MRRKTPEDYHALAAKRGFEWLGPKVPNTHARTRWRCSHGHEWWVEYWNIQRGSGCPMCAGNAPKTPGDYRNLAALRGFSWLGPNVPNTKTKTKWRCGDGHEWWVKYSDIQQGSGCPICADNVAKTPENYYGLAAERGFEWLGPKARNNATNTKWRCSEGHEWWTLYNSIQQGGGCPVCTDKAKTPEDYYSLAAERGFEWLGPEVPTVLAKTEWRCGKGHKWWTVYNSIRRGYGCPICNESKGETAVASALDALSIGYCRQSRFRKCRNERPLPFDFSFTFQGVRFLVEYDGQQHFEPVEFFGGDESFETRQLHDQIKDEFAATYGFTLIRIPYTTENIQSYLIQAIAVTCGIEYGDVLITSNQKKAAVKSQSIDSQPAVGKQMSLF